MILREPINGLTHFIGALLAIAALVVLVVKSAIDGTAWHVVSFSIYGTSMFLLYLFSSLYHWLPLRYKGVLKMRKLDHMMIFVMIAGSYTPMCLIPLRGPWGWSLFGTIWGIAITGFFIKIFWLNAPRVLYVSIYIVMGWLVVIAIYPISKVFPTGGMVWLAIGGIFYTFGAVIYAKKKPNPIPNIFGFHEIWHIFVMLGSGAHFWMMWRYILPMG
ncbi:hemolysin III family protein [bacterium]|nr:hemolysin III family protein [bacterium]